jgi:uncharacterized protein with ParB-like and HNH nuclease domain
MYEVDMAKNTLLETDTVNLNEILGNGKQYQVPIYQRDYSWELENWEDLWSDIVVLGKTEQPHYMGAVVFQTTDRKKFTIIDGQQRLATLSILILAAIENINQLINAGVEAESNTERKELLMNTYLGAKDAVSLNYSSKLFLNENDDSFYQSRLLQFRAPNIKSKLSKSEKLMWGAFEFYRDRISDQFKSNKNGADLAAFISTLVADRLMFINIVVDDVLNAYTVFETLNARGLELTTTDLLKNYLLSKMLQSKQDQRIAKEQWQRIVQTVGLGVFPRFLRYYWNSQNPFTRQDRLFKTIRDAVTEPQEVFDLLDNLEKTADLYAALNDSNDEFWEGKKEILNRIRELNLFNVTQCFPLLISAYFKFNLQEFEQILRIVSVVSFRYNVISNLNPNLQENIYNQTAQKIFKGGIKTIREIRQEMKPIYPDDDQFTSAFSSKILNTKQNKKIIRYILYALENQMAATDRNYEDESGTIEHILPENPSQEWEASFNIEDQPNYIYRLGNYTLLETGKNKECHNRYYPDKLPIYKTSQYQMTKSFDYPEWSPSQLRRRQQKMGNIASAIWRLEF